MSGIGRGMNKTLQWFGMGVPDMPEMEKANTMPTVNDEQRLAVKEREVLKKRKGKGRAGTILNGDSKLG